MSKPLFPHQVSKHGKYWSAMGDTRWSAVQITSISRKWTKATRVNPKTGAVKKKGAKVRIDELLRRDPDLIGADKPEDPPKVVFAEVREARARREKKSEEQLEDTDIDDEMEEFGGCKSDNKSGSETAGKSARVPVEPRIMMDLGRVDAVLELLEDKSTDKEW